MDAGRREQFLIRSYLNMAADRIKPMVGESDLIDGALRGSRSKEDGYMEF